MEKETTTQQERIQEATDKLELIKYTSQVQARIKTDITSDVVLAKLEQKDKESIIEMTANAYFAKKVITQIAQNAKKHQWQNQQWTTKTLTPQDKEYQEIIKIAEKVFDTYMIRITMTTLLNRNVEKNHLLNILAQQHTEEQEEQQKISILKNPKKAIENEEINN